MSTSPTAVGASRSSTLTADGQFTKPEDVAIDAQGYVYVTDSRLGVQKFTNTGVFVTGW